MVTKSCIIAFWGGGGDTTHTHGRLYRFVFLFADAYHKEDRSDEGNSRGTEGKTNTSPDQDVPLTISSVAFKEAVPAVVQAATPALFQQLKDSKHPDEELAEHSGVPPKAPHVLQAMPLVNAQLAAGIATDHLMLIEQSIQQQIQDMTGERVKVSRKIYFLACRPLSYPRTKSLTYRTQIC